MKTHVLQISGGLVLLACMVFAILRFDSADKWVSVWIPFVIAGVALALLGTILGKKKDCDRRVS